jgi:hypothetical protein
VTTKNFVHYIYNTKYVFRRHTKYKARHGTSQFIMPHECTHIRFKSCKVTTKNFVHYICNIVQHIFFTAIRNVKLVTARRSLSCRTNVRIHVSSHVMRRKISFIHYICNSRHIFHRNMKIQSSSQHSAARRSLSQLVMPYDNIYGSYTSCYGREKNYSRRINKKYLWCVVLTPRDHAVKKTMARPLPG